MVQTSQTRSEEPEEPEEPEGTWRGDKPHSYRPPAAGGKGVASAEMSWQAVPKDKNQKEVREEENERCVGGQRNPRRAVNRIPGLRVVGCLVRAAFRTFRIAHLKEVDRVVETFGTPQAAQPDGKLVEEFRAALRRTLGASVELRSRPKWGAPSPLQANLFDKWLLQAGDPERALKPWIEGGVPLGIEREIDCYNIFPPNTTPKKCPVRFSSRDGGSSIENYLSMKEQPEDADIEIERLIGLIFLARVPRKVLTRIVGSTGRPARLALIVK